MPTEPPVGTFYRGPRTRLGSRPARNPPSASLDSLRDGVIGAPRGQEACVGAYLSAGGS